MVESLSYHPLLDSFLHPKSASNQEFIEEERRIRYLNSEFLFFEMWNESFNPAINWIISSVILGWIRFFLLNLSSYIIIFLFGSVD